MQSHFNLNLHFAEPVTVWENLLAIPTMLVGADQSDLAASIKQSEIAAFPAQNTVIICDNISAIGT
jgi:hypothetical protein